jgi:ABC-2 type transport system ATP-binding protein
MALDVPAVSVQGLTKRFGNTVAVDNLSFEVPPGVVAGFVGPNGAGKSTTLAVLLGLIRPTAGSATVLGYEIAQPAAYIHRVGALIEGPAFYRSLTGRQNLELVAGVAGHDPARVGPVLDEVELADRADDRYRTYSTGMKQRLGIAAALLGDPDLLLLDEPASGLDPVGIAQMRTVVKTLAGNGRSLLVSSHALADLEQVCDWLVMIDRGTCLYQGAAAQLLAASGIRVLVAPEHPDDLARLHEALVVGGHQVERRDGHLVVPVDGTDSTSVAIAVNREAAAAGITLAQLETAAASLEDRYLAMMQATDEGGEG